MNFRIEEIKKIDLKNLPGQIAHQQMLPSYRGLELPVGIKPTNSAVLLLFFYWEGELSLCFTVRKKSLRRHAGQISFPGGRSELNESLRETALRETHEEIGIEPEKVSVLGELTPLYIGVSNYMVHPILGFIHEKPVFKSNDDEVEEILIIPFSKIIDNKSLQMKNIQTSVGNLDVPCFYINNQIIWGATSMILSELVMLLKPDYFDRVAHSNNAENDR